MRPNNPNEYLLLKSKYPCRSPVIVILDTSCTFSLIKTKFLVRYETSLGELMMIIRNSNPLCIGSDKAVVAIIGGRIYPMTTLMSIIEKDSADGFIYMSLVEEQSFG